jgi:hypothetical protein
LEAVLTTKRQFTPPPKELVERWVEESKSKPTIHAAYGYITYKAAEWAHNAALDPDPNSLKQQALRGLERIQNIDVVSVWTGRDVFDVIRQALDRLPDGI